MVFLQNDEIFFYSTHTNIFLGTSQGIPSHVVFMHLYQQLRFKATSKTIFLADYHLEIGSVIETFFFPSSKTRIAGELSGFGPSKVASRSFRSLNLWRNQEEAENWMKIRRLYWGNSFKHMCFVFCWLFFVFVFPYLTLPLIGDCLSHDGKLAECPHMVTDFGMGYLSWLG